MQDYVFEAFWWLLGKVGIEPDTSGARHLCGIVFRNRLIKGGKGVKGGEVD